MKMNMVELQGLLVKETFSGTVLVKENGNAVTVSNGFANRSEEIKNGNDTRFGIASGCKLFTSIAICQLVENGLISFNTRLQDCLQVIFPHFDTTITIHHLLTHTSGIPDYFDEEEMDDFEELWVQNPMYRLRRLSDFLSLFQHKPMKHTVGEKFHYNNAGYIILGLIVEAVSGMEFAEYVTEHVLKNAHMNDSGYFELDRLPAHTAIGYIDEEEGVWRTNTYSVPVKGGSDGGAFVTVGDMANVWEALLNHTLLTPTTTEKLLTPFIHTDDDYDRFYGYGVWIDINNDDITKYHVMGYDPGVSFHSAYYPATGNISVVCSNKSEGAFDIFKAVELQMK